MTQPLNSVLVNSQIMTRREVYKTKNYLIHGLFFFFYGLFKYCSFPFSNYPRYLILKLFLKRIETSHVKDGVTFFFPQNIVIGKQSSINEGVFLHGLGGLIIGSNVRIAPHTLIHTYDHGFTEADLPVNKQDYIVGRVTIEDDVWIGAGVCIVKGVTIGKGAVVGAGAVVTRDIPPYAVAAGVPAKVIRYRNANQNNPAL